MSRLRTLVAVFAMLALLSACARTTVVRTPLKGKPSVSRPVSPPKSGSSALIRRGDTLYRIATTYGVSPLDLAVWNRIPPPYTIYPGQRLRLTAPDVRRADPARTDPARNDPARNDPRRNDPSRYPPPIAGTSPKPPATRPPAAPLSWPGQCLVAGCSWLVGYCGTNARCGTCDHRGQRCPWRPHD